MKRLDLTGQVFGRLAVLGFSHMNKSGKSHFICLCECGNITTPSGANLKNGNSSSCGCLHNELLSENNKIQKIGNKNNLSHGLSHSLLYQKYLDMKKRCYNSDRSDYKYYGGKGIRICDEWIKDFGKFYCWAIENGWEVGLTIDRIDPERDYSPDNCQFVTQSENSKRRNEHYRCNTTS